MLIRGGYFFMLIMSNSNNARMIIMYSISITP